MTPEQALEQAVQIVGTKSKLAAELGLSLPSVSVWERCPLKYALAVEAAVQKALKAYGEGPTRYDLCPEAFGERPFMSEKSQ
jgi:DNA-binding transcriptional regulator YdaS (Cro superfamily)